MKIPPLGCLTLYLVVIVATMTFLAVNEYTAAVESGTLSITSFLEFAAGTLSALYGLCAFAIGYRRKWGYYGILVLAFVAILIDLLILGKNPIRAMLPPLILYGLLTVGGENSLWKRMK